MALNLRGSFLPPLFPVIFSVAVLFAAVPATAQHVALQSRITAQIDNSRRSTLVGSRSPLAITANDVGAVDPSTQLQGITVVFSPTPSQKTALDALAAAQQNASSPQYHRWLQPEQFAAQFGMADADIATVSSWLEREGFVVGAVSRSRNRLTFSGNAGQVATAFGAPLHNYKGKGEATSHFSPAGDLTIPVAFRSVIQSVGNLSTFQPHSNAVIPKPRLQPLYTSAGGQMTYLVPPDVATIYDVKPAYQAGHNGNGQTIAVIGQSTVNPQDLANFQTALGIPIKPQSMNLIPNTGAARNSTGDETESALDLEYTSAMAPGANVSLYFVGDSPLHNAFDSIVYVIDNNLANVISVSYAACEGSLGPWYVQSLDLSFEQAAVQGQTIVAAAGDYGSVSCTPFMGSVAFHEAPAVEFPASSPWVVGLGGTQFPVADIGDPVNPTYWASSGTGDTVSSALSYIPEQIWNDYEEGYSSGGGGISIYEPQPLWQAGVAGSSPAGFRLVPDISLNSSPQLPGYLMCTSDMTFGNADSCTVGFHNAQGRDYDVVGGTSVAAPIFAGLVAVLNEAKGYTAGQGLINPTLYALASDPATYAAAFHDITSGDNACTDIAICGIGPQNTAYAAGIGYDEASGLGSIDFAALLAAWPENAMTPAVETTTALNVSTQTLVYGNPLTLTATVSSGTGSVYFYFEDNGPYLVGSAMLNSGVATLTLPGGIFPIQNGTDSFTAVYGGNTGYDPSTSTAVAVNIVTAPTSTVITSSSTTPAFGAPVTLTAAVKSGGLPMPDGAWINFLDNGQEAGNVYIALPTAAASMSYVPHTGGLHSITATFSGDFYYSASTSTSVVVNVAPAATTIILTADRTNTVFGANVSLLATISSANPLVNGGTVTFLNGGTVIGTWTPVAGGEAALYVSSLPVGSNSLTVSYGGTQSLAAAVSPVLVVTVAATPTTTTLSGSSSTIAFGGAETLTATVMAGGSPASSGTVSFLNGASVIGTGTVSNGVVILDSSNLPVGSNAITANFGGTSNVAPSASSTFVVTVNPDTTTTSLSASSTSPFYGSTVTLTATVTVGGSRATSGVVTFLSGGLPVATGSVNSSGVAMANLSSLTVGANSIIASYGASSNFAASASSAVVVTVTPDTTTTVLSQSSTSSTYGSNVSFTATVSVGGSPATSGVVAFLSGGLPLATASVNSSGVATINLASLPVGTESISAVYAGTSSLASSVSNTVMMTVSPGVTMTALRSSSPILAFGSSVTLTATVANANNPVTSGTVSFLNNGQPIGAATINNGVAAISLTSLTVGSDSIAVSFTGTLNFAASTSSPVMVTVSLAQTATSLSVSSENPTFGSGVTFTATVENGNSSVPSGTVTFLDGGSVIGTGTVINGVATLNLTTLPAGVNQVSASFAGTSTLAASVSSTVLVTVTSAQASTATTLISSTTTPAPGDSVMFTAVVTSNGTPVANGTVNFLNGVTSIGTGTLYNGVALMSLTTLPVGANSISASFGGISSYAASASNAVIVTVTLPVTAAPPVVTISAPPLANPGGVVTTTASFSAGASYSGTMMLACKLTGPPAGAQSVPTCGMNPSTLKLAANGVGTAVLSVQTTAASTTSQARNLRLNLWGLGAGSSALAGLFMFCVPSRRRRVFSALAVLIVFATVGFTGCGGGTAAIVAPPIVTPATTAGAYLFTVSGTDALNPVITTSTVVSVTVQ